ncbi:hypothetical protein SASPL_139856 [Salvia splendens]|uniref:DUF4378 domain-containing protein n=1 Tax=Salvia splendens TaxID=180675 RepID=A0A8X8ZB27_SALSN|nr:protein LONGIFOLIA 1-like [Salvia splendens]XP_042020771.1 protein LONGIFOLIA 1-like [Salvia splendens]KAG6398396.1 hypothetical protein SASPL_139856 [Salvia splendens]
MSSSLRDENRDLRKQMGCMNGIFQIFDRHHFITGRRISSCSSKRLLQGGQHQMGQQYATKSVVEKGMEMQKEKPRISSESSRASFSSSSCSSTFSSLDFNRAIQPETLSLRQISIPESPYQTPPSKARQPSSTQGTGSQDLRDVVKDSMHREVRSLSIKSQSNDERRGTVMKHIDSPRPLQPFKTEKPKAASQSGVPRGLAKDERLALPRFSYDGRESREVYKSAMKPKELPRLSLDSKTNSMKAYESRLNFLGKEMQVENLKSSQVIHPNQELGSHQRTSSVVARLMGLDAFPEAISTDEIRTPTMKSCIKEAFLSQPAEEHNKQIQSNHSPCVSQNTPASPSSKLQSASSVRKPTTFSRFPVEPAPWRQQDSSQCSPKMASKCRKVATTTLHQTSVYGEIEKRITDLEFKKSGKDLRALKQILEAMQKTRARMEDERGVAAQLTSQRRGCLEESCPHQNSKLAMWKNNKTFCHPTVKEPRSPKQLDSIVIAKPAKVMEKVKLSVPAQLSTVETSHLQNLTPKYHRGSSVHSQKANNLTPENRNVRNQGRHLHSSEKKTSWSSSELDRVSTTTPRMKVENYTTPGRSSGTVSPRLQQNALRAESESARVGKYGSKKVMEKGSQNRKNRVKAKDQQLSDDQMSEISGETRYMNYQGDTASVVSESNNSIVSQSETEVTSLARSIKTNTRQDKNHMSTTRERMPAVESVVTMLEQPSPISVLDNTFYCEDSPSPIKKITTVFQEDEGQSPDEQWCLQNLNHLMDCTRLNNNFKYNQKLENVGYSVQELTQLNKKIDGASVNHNDSLNPDYRYINKILLTSGLLKDSSIISTTEKLFSSHHLINPDMFHVLEQTEDIREAVNGAVIEKNDKLNLDKRIQRKMIFDLVDEILVHKITSSRLYTVEKKWASPQGLLKEVHLEMDRLCRISDCDLEEEDEMTRLLNADMMHNSEDWVDYRGEVPALVLDIERQIFKDLINEVITGDAMDVSDWPKRHYRKLFGK